MADEIFSVFLRLTWLGVLLLCVSVSGKCKSPLAGGAVHGTLSPNKDEYNVSNTVQLTCDHGYRLPPGGQAGFRCTASGTWTPAPVRCVLPTCSDPFQGMTGGDTRAIPSIVGVSKTEFAQNEKVQIQCNPEYNFPRTGNTLTCGSSGDWLTPPQRCEAIKCSRTLLSERGYSLENITRDYRVGEKVTAQCKVGFWAPGGAFISICGEKGHFNSVPVECKQVECRRVSPPSHVTISYHRFGPLTVGASMVYGCNGNYEISPGKGHVKRTCEATNTSLAGRWSGPEPVCRLFCRKMSVLSSQSIVYQGAGGETVSGAKFPPNTEAIFSCQKYHQLIGDATRRCQGNGQWTHSQPRCQKLTCRALPQVDNGSTRYSKNLDISSIANHRCNTGYKLNGTLQQSCSATQLWTGKLPTCEKILCPPLSSIKGGSVIFDRSVGSRGDCQVCQWVQPHVRVNPALSRWRHLVCLNSGVQRNCVPRAAPPSAWEHYHRQPLKKERISSFIRLWHWLQAVWQRQADLLGKLDLVWRVSNLHSEQMHTSCFRFHSRPNRSDRRLHLGNDSEYLLQCRLQIIWGW